MFLVFKVGFGLFGRGPPHTPFVRIFFSQCILIINFSILFFLFELCTERLLLQLEMSVFRNYKRGDKWIGIPVQKQAPLLPPEGERADVAL